MHLAPALMSMHQAMQLHPHFLFLAVLLLPHLPTSISTPAGSKDIDYWCDRTPHPKPCRHYLGRYANRDVPKNSTEFYKLSLQVAFDLAVRAQGRLKRQNHTCSDDPPARKAWLDCWKLYGNTIIQLNRTIYPPDGGPRDALDSQTWLSAALTNLETCLKSFEDVGASRVIIDPVVGYNVSDVISNCLAINRPVAQADAGTSSDRAGGEASSWMMIANRKLLQLSAQADFVVAKDGSGRFSTIKAALDAAAAQMQNKKKARYVIYIKAGVYNEIVQVVNSMSDLTMVGDGIGKTIITGGRSVANGFTTLSSATFSVFGDGFIASGITFRNTFGPGSQAVALLSASDRSAFYRCSIEGYQDTLYVYSQRQFYRECNIYGTIDFIFGNAAVVLQNCYIFPRLPRHGESNVITAQGRTDPNQNTGIVIQSSTIKPATDLFPQRHSVKSYLGRPWMEYSRTIYMQNYIDSFIDPAGWLPFNGGFALNTLYYAEYGNTGPGARMSRRVRWPGYHIIRRPSLVRPFTVGRFLAGNTWIPATRVPFKRSF